MHDDRLIQELEELKKGFAGDIFTEMPWRLMYATDASAYREIPLAVTRPKTRQDVIRLIRFAREHHSSLIPRAAGTSLAGQVVGGGIILDISKYWKRILEVNPAEKWVRVEPGVNLDELNLHLESFGLFFGPETATSSRCLLGGMVGNNSCGAHSLIYGSTRDHTIAVKAILSDGSEVEFGPLSRAAFAQKCEGKSLESEIYRSISAILSNPHNQREIREHYPDPSIKRRNNGYALDLLLETEPFTDTDTPINLAKLICGSEGTLAFITEIKLNLVPLPPSEKALLCVHCETLEEAFKGNLIALKYHPGSVELMDDVIIECTKDNLEQQKNRFFIKGQPKAILIAEFARQSRAELDQITGELEAELRAAGYGYHYPVITGDDIQRVWNLRKAGLGLLSNIPGDAKPVPVIEDTAVKPEDLPAYMEDFKKILDKHKKSCVYYAHIGSGELHLRPVLNLKDPDDVRLFHDILAEVAALVKSYRGSLSGEHGDGRLRGEFIAFMVGEKNYQFVKAVKQSWDRDNIFNPGKIVDTPPMNSSLRYPPGFQVPEIETIFDFSKSEGMLRAIERCNGSGDCLKSPLIGGTMCPSYMATRDEQHVTRARANILREYISRSEGANPFDHAEIYEVLDLCLACKACKSECPSSVDIAKLKAEFLQHYYDAHHIPLRTRAIAYLPKIHALGSILPAMTNFFLKNALLSTLIKKVIRFAPQRTIPLLQRTTLHRWVCKQAGQLNRALRKGTVYLYSDEFTNFLDTDIGIKAILLLNRLGYAVRIPRMKESGRTYISKGLLRTARKLANRNISILKDKISAETPLIGIEPSAILGFRDEYPELVSPDLREDAREIARNAVLFEEFFERAVAKGLITPDQFTDRKQHIRLHGHCQQKAVASTEVTKQMLAFPHNYSVDEIPSGCCGMAGAFGYEKEHYEISMKVGELVLFPEVRKTPKDVLIAAPGTSCRQQIKDGTDRQAYHPIEIMYRALRSD